MSKWPLFPMRFYAVDAAVEAGYTEQFFGIYLGAQRLAEDSPQPCQKFVQLLPTGNVCIPYRFYWLYDSDIKRLYSIAFNQDEGVYQNEAEIEPVSAED